MNYPPIAAFALDHSALVEEACLVTSAVGRIVGTSDFTFLACALIVMERNDGYYVVKDVHREMERHHVWVKLQTAYQYNNRLLRSSLVTGLTEGRQYFKAKKYEVTHLGTLPIREYYRLITAQLSELIENN